MSSEYSEFNAFNRYQNLDSIEAKIISHLLNSQSKAAQILWKILKYDTMDALSHENLTYDQRQELIFQENGQSTGKRVFYAPFVDDAWQEQCSSLYVYVANIYPKDHEVAIIGVNIETVVHSKVSIINGDSDVDFYKNVEEVNPNDTGLDTEGNNVVAFKNRETVLLKCVLAELNGLYIDGVGYLQLNTRVLPDSNSKNDVWNNRSM